MVESRLPPTFQEQDLNYYLRMIRGDYSTMEEVAPRSMVGPSQVKNLVLVFTSDAIGVGNELLGKKLMLHLLQSVVNGSHKPRAIILLNGAVRMASGRNDTIGRLTVLEEQGSKIMVCVSSAEEYGIIDNINVGFVASMDEIVESLMTALKVITL